jgi:transcriptional regulator with XRE-family HTH domain
MTSLSQWIRHARKKVNLRQSDVAERLGILRSTVAHWETNRTIPKKDVFCRFEELVGQTFGTDIDIKEQLKDGNFKTLSNQDIDALLILLKIQQLNNYDFIVLIQSFLKEKNT